MSGRTVASFLAVSLACVSTLSGQMPIDDLLQRVEGLTEPAQTVRVAAGDNGTIQDILVKQGQAVTKGTPLLQMDQDILWSTLQLARNKADSRAKIEAAKIERQVKQRRVENLERIGKENASSEELIRAKADLALAETAVLAAEEDMEQNRLEAKRIEVQLEKRTIRSPIDGVVTRIHRQVGELVTGSDPIVVTVVDLNRLRIVMHPASAIAQRYTDATRARVKLAPETILEASVDYVSPVTDADSNTVRMELILDNPKGIYRSGDRCWLLDAPPMAGWAKNRISRGSLNPSEPKQ